MIDRIYENGNTIRLKCTFKDFNNITVNPEDIKIIFYDDKYQNPVEFTAEIEQVSFGTFIFDYTPSGIIQNRNLVFYEWYGVVNGKVSSKRRPIKSQFISNEVL